MKRSRLFLVTLLGVALPSVAMASVTAGSPAVFGIHVEFVIFGLILLGIALFHRRTFEVAVTGLVVLLAFKLAFTNFHLIRHFRNEWPMLLNLFGLLIGFAILARHFEESKVPAEFPRWLPDDWKGGFVLLVFVFILSTFLDNIAAAMIGGAVAHVVYRHRVHIGFLAAIVAASNAGGAGSVIGDTTTTMMWIDGVAAGNVLHAFVGSAVSLLFFGIIASRQQQAYQPIVRDVPSGIRIDFGRVMIVVLILTGAIAANILLEFPAVGVWIAILIGATFRKTPWHELQKSLKGSLFLLALVTCASMMPVQDLPPASWKTAFGLGWISAVFDNIPLTKLALDQGGYDWGFLAYAVGFGGSIIWFGSSAGVAITNMFPEARSVFAWLKHAWHIPVGYLLGFFAMLWIMGWQPHAPHQRHGRFEKVPISSPRTDTILNQRPRN